MKKSLNRWTLILFVLILTIVAGCSNTAKQTADNQTVSTSDSPKSSSEEPKATETIELTFANWISTEDATKEAYNQLVAAFEAANPNIKIKSLGIPFNQYKDQVLVASTGGNTPDVFMANQGFTPAFVAAGIAAPLDELLGSEIIDDILPASKSGVTIDGKVYAAPWTPHPNALFWNKTLYQKAGLDPNSPPTTWEELLAHAKAIATLKQDDKGNPIYGLAEATKTGSYTGQMLLRNTYGFGGQFVDEAGKLILDQGTALADTLQYYRDLTSQNLSPTGAEIKDLRGMFSNGSLGLLIDGDFGRSNFRSISGKGEAFDQEWGVTLVPINKTGRSETVFTEHQLLVSASSKHQEAAATFVKYLVSKEAAILYHQLNGVLSSRASIAALPEMNEDDYAKLFNEQMKTASAFPTKNPKFDNAMNEASNLIVLATTSDLSISEIIAKQFPKIQELYITQ